MSNLLWDEPGESYHVIRGTADITDSRHGGIFTFISPATEKLKKQDTFQPRDKSYLQNITKSEAEPLKDGSASNVGTPKTASFLLRQLNFVTADISHISFGNPLKLYLLARICFVRQMLFSVGACLVFKASTERKISLLRSTYDSLVPRPHLTQGEGVWCHKWASRSTETL